MSPRRFIGRSVAACVIGSLLVACGGRGTSISLPPPVPTPIPQLFVANYGSNSVTQYPLNNLTTASPVTISAGVNLPAALTFNRAGDLFVANRGNDTVTTYPSSSYATAAPTVITAGISFCPSGPCWPPALALDLTGDLFVVNDNNDTMTEYPANNLTTASPTVIPANSIRYTFITTALALDAAGNLYIANCFSSSMTFYKPPDTVTEYPAGYYTTTSPITISAGIDCPLGLLFDASGNLFVLNHDGSYLGGSSAVGSVTKYPAGNYTTFSPTVITSGMSYPYAMALDAAGNLFVANCGCGTPGSVTIYPSDNLTTGSPTVVSSGINVPVALALDAVGNLFVANYGNNTVTMYPSTNYKTTSPTVISTGVNAPFALAVH